MAYTPAKTVAYENAIGFYAFDLMADRELLDGPVSLTVFAQFQIPKSRAKGKNAVFVGSWHVGKPDGDNILKAVGDALNGIVWRDDCQVAMASIIKTYSDKPRLVIEVKPV